LAHLLLQRAGFNRWYPRMQGKRTWYIVRKHLLAAAHEIETKGVRLADVLLIPEPFVLDDAAAIASRRARTMAVLLSPGEDVQFKLMLVMAELKEFSATDIDYRIVCATCPTAPCTWSARPAIASRRCSSASTKRGCTCVRRTRPHQRTAGGFDSSFAASSTPNARGCTSSTPPPS
jgi:hypothetical protein